MTILVSCIIYTLEDQPVNENKYIPIFITWLAHILKYGKFTLQDALRITIDKDTLDFLQKDNLYKAILSGISCQKDFLIIPRPKTHAQGMMSKYIYKEYTQTYFMYCDIDVLIRKPLSLLVNVIPENTIAVQAEGTLADTNYNKLFPENWIREHGAKHLGFSAGKFIIHGSSLCKDLFEIVNKIASQYSIESFYTVEQPVLNYAIYSIPRDKYNVDINILKPPLICVNGHGEQEDKIFLMDLMGEPGNGPAHFEKIFGLLIEYFLTH